MKALKRKPKKQSFEEMFRILCQNLYLLEKILHIRVTSDFPERKVYWFIEMVKQDKEFKTDG